MHFVLSDRIKLIISVQCIIVIALSFSSKFKYIYSHSTKNRLRGMIIPCKICNYNSGQLYEDAFNISYNWKKWLPPDVYRYHELVCKEVNAPVELQMGILLPFILSVCGPFTKGHFFGQTFLLKFILAEYSSIRSKKITDNKMDDFRTIAIYTTKHRTWCTGI